MPFGRLALIEDDIVELVVLAKMTPYEYFIPPCVPTRHAIPFATIASTLSASSSSILVFRGFTNCSKRKQYWNASCSMFISNG